MVNRGQPIINMIFFLVVMRTAYQVKLVLNILQNRSEREVKNFGLGQIMKFRNVLSYPTFD